MVYKFEILYHRKGKEQIKCWHRLECSAYMCWKKGSKPKQCFAKWWCFYFTHESYFHYCDSGI